MKIRSTLGYSAAVLTIFVALLVPFFLYMFFAKGVNAMGLHVDEVYVAGPVVRTVAMNGYEIQIHKEFHPRLLQRAEPFVQIAWTPMKSLPPQVSDEVDVDGDGKPDVRVSFAVPKNVRAGTTVNVDSLNPRFIPLQGAGANLMTRMIAPVGDKIVVRIPLKK